MPTIVVITLLPDELAAVQAAVCVTLDLCGERLLDRFPEGYQPLVSAKDKLSKLAIAKTVISA